MCGFGRIGARFRTWSERLSVTAEKFRSSASGCSILEQSPTCPGALEPPAPRPRREGDDGSPTPIQLRALRLGPHCGMTHGATGWPVLPPGGPPGAPRSLVIIDPQENSQAHQGVRSALQCQPSFTLCCERCSQRLDPLRERGGIRALGWLFGQCGVRAPTEGLGDPRVAGWAPLGVQAGPQGPGELEAPGAGAVGLPIAGLGGVAIGATAPTAEGPAATGPTHGHSFESSQATRRRKAGQDRTHQQRGILGAPLRTPGPGRGGLEPSLFLVSGLIQRGAAG